MKTIKTTTRGEQFLQSNAFPCEEVPPLPTGSNVHSIIAWYLDFFGFDGLFNSEDDCGCLQDDLCPCGEFGDCCPGYRYDCPVCGEWSICASKPGQCANPDCEKFEGET